MQPCSAPVVQVVLGGRLTEVLVQNQSKCGQPRRGSGPWAHGLGSGGGGGGHDSWTVSLGQDRLPFKPRLLTSSLQMAHAWKQV